MCVCPTVRCTGISKKPVGIYGGIFGASQTDSKGQFLFTVLNAAVSAQKNGHSRRNAVEPRRATFYRGGYNYTPNTFEGRTAALYGRI